MKTNLVRILALSAIATAVGSAQQVDAAQAHAQKAGGGAQIAGVWDVAVTVVNCQTGALIRNVRSVQMYQPDGAFSETANTGRAERASDTGTVRKGRSMAQTTSSSDTTRTGASPPLPKPSTQSRLAPTAASSTSRQRFRITTRTTACSQQAASRRQRKGCEPVRQEPATETVGTGRAWCGQC
jgi:hypothetical protein